MNRCPKIEYGRLSSEIAWMGVNTRTLTARKPQLSGRGIQRMALNRVTIAGGATDAAIRAQELTKTPASVQDSRSCPLVVRALTRLLKP